MKYFVLVLAVLLTGCIGPRTLHNVTCYSDGKPFYHKEKVEIGLGEGRFYVGENDIVSGNCVVETIK